MLHSKGLRKLWFPRFFQMFRDPKTGWELVESTDSVAVFLYVADIDQVILLYENRVPMRTVDNPTGKTLGPVAGRLDKPGMSPKEIAALEAFEECGATVHRDQIEMLNGGQPLALSAGILTERTYLAFAMIHSDQLGDDRKFGNPHEHEDITRVMMPSKEFLDPHRIHEDLRVMMFAEWFQNYQRR